MDKHTFFWRSPKSWPQISYFPYYFSYTNFYVNLIGRPPTYRIFLFFPNVLHDIIRWTIQKGSTLVDISQKFTTGLENPQTFIFDSYQIYIIKFWPKPLRFSLHKISYHVLVNLLFLFWIYRILSLLHPFLKPKTLPNKEWLIMYSLSQYLRWFFQNKFKKSNFITK